MILYRYEDNAFYYDEPYLEIFKIVKETPCGYWIRRMYEEISCVDVPKRWMRKSTKTAYAYPTRMEALKAYRARKYRQVTILEEQLKKATRWLNITKSLLGEK